MPPSPIKEVRDEVITKDGIDCPEMNMDEHHPPTNVCSSCKGVFDDECNVFYSSVYSNYQLNSDTKVT